MSTSDLPYVKVTAPKRQRLSDSICAQIERLIADGTLAPGHALPAERELAARFGVSRPSVREALLRLEAHGLLEAARRGGFAVADLSASALTGPLARLLQAHPSATRDAVELSHGLELLAVQHAAMRATSRDHARLRRCHERLCDPQRPRDPKAEARLDAEFHAAIAQASHNVVLAHVLNGLQHLLQTPIAEAGRRVEPAPAEASRLQAQHRSILEALLAGDAARARDAARRHLDAVGKRLPEGDDTPRPAPARPA